MRDYSKHLKRFLASTTATSIALAPIPGRANPLGSQVTAGSATVQGQGTANVTINQSSNRAIINWQTFNIAPNETTQFIQPGSSSATLNRVTGGLGASDINGTIKANGGVYIVNPDGLLFGPNAKINVGSFLGTTNDIANSDFMAGNNNFTIPGSPSASIVNQGHITAASGGFAALVAPGVRNDGVISANLGTVALASGNGFTLDLYGDSLIKLQPGDAIAANVRDVATGQTMTSLVQNTGKLKANGGKVMLTAVTAKKVLDSVINSSGVIEANSVGTKNGLVVFGAATGSKPAGAPVQTVKVSGKIKTAGKKAGTKGGKIQITGENVVLANAKLDASGKAGGGTILVGGDFMGGNPNAPAVTLYGQSFETTPVPNATTVNVDSASILNASAITSGNGGKVVVWSNLNTAFAGSILAKGGSTSGNGGFIETSGHTLNIDGASVSAAAPKGQPGHWLLDPSDYTIDQYAASTIEEALLQGDVSIATLPDGNAGNGDIIVNSGIAWTTNSFLLLDAYHSVTINGPIVGTNIAIVTNDGGTGGYFTVNSTVSPSSSLNINGINYTLINNQQELQAINTNPNIDSFNNYATTGNYALASDITLTGSFAPLGGPFSNEHFQGNFEGLGHTIYGLNVANTTPWNQQTLPGDGYYLGLFGYTVGSSVIENLKVLNANINLNGQAAAGVLGGEIQGTVYNVSVSGTVTGSGNIGGLAGGSSANIISSSANVNISSAGGTIGGLVGFGYTNSAIINSYATGNITVIRPYGSDDIIGGLVGNNYPEFSNLITIINSYATGNISLTNTSTDGRSINDDFGYIGSLIGQNFYASGNTGFATGTVTITNCPNCSARGLVGAGYPVIGTLSTIATLQAQAAVTAALVAASETIPAPATPVVTPTPTPVVTTSPTPTTTTTGSGSSSSSSSTSSSSSASSSSSSSSTASNGSGSNTSGTSSGSSTISQTSGQNSSSNEANGTSSGTSLIQQDPYTYSSFLGSPTENFTVFTNIALPLNANSANDFDWTYYQYYGAPLNSPTTQQNSVGQTESTGDVFIEVGSQLGQVLFQGGVNAGVNVTTTELQSGVNDLRNLIANWYTSSQENGPSVAQAEAFVELGFIVEQQWLAVELGNTKLSGAAATFVTTGQKSLYIVIMGIGKIIITAYRNG